MTDAATLRAFFNAPHMRHRIQPPELRSMIGPNPGDTWMHTDSGREYRITRRAWDCITDEPTVLYENIVVGTMYTRQLRNHPKAFLSLNRRGQPRFVPLVRA